MKEEALALFGVNIRAIYDQYNIQAIYEHEGSL